MASGLATRCPACSTVFRVVPDQLRVSEGWVRCGRCSEVFDASRSLTDIDTGEPRQAALAAPPVAAPAPAEDDAWIGRIAEPSRAPEPARDSQPVDSDFTADDRATRPDGSAATAGLTATDPRAEPGDRPSFVVRAERAERWRRPPVRAALAVVIVAGTLGLAAQAAVEYRDLAAARFPATRPLLVQACAALGCTVEAARVIDSLAVESSGLVRVEKSSIYRLSVVLRNRATIDVALPALDVTLTDSQGRLIARKVVRVADLGAAQATIGAGREIALQATLQAAAAASAPAPALALETIAGYTIELFYP